ncbi:hypothetical protein [Aliiroseovarius crassostreae]|nr:hypothetical protein [Aliiroseovarius crassostreae]
MFLLLVYSVPADGVYDAIIGGSEAFLAASMLLCEYHAVIKNITQ